MENFLLKYEHIIIDNLDSWPAEIKSVMQSYNDTFRNYYSFENDIDSKAIEDVLLRTNRPSNPYKSYWESGLKKLKMTLSNCAFMGFHCTRLTQNEIDSIKVEGLRPLSRKLIDERIDKLIECGYINESIVAEFRNDNRSEDQYRKGLVFTFHTSGTLLNSCGLDRLFRCWGGESFSLIMRVKIDL